MRSGYREVDFLIVTALKDETEAVIPLLMPTEVLTHAWLGMFRLEQSTGHYLVALVEIGGMGTNAAQAVASEALTSLNPKRVILTGIAAGFPEAGVNFGDVLIPYYVAPYELAKLKERPSGIREMFYPLFRWLIPKARNEVVEYDHR